MAACKDVLRCSLVPIPASSFLRSKHNKLRLSSPALVSSKTSRPMRAVRTPVAAISDDILKLVAWDKSAEKLNVRVVMTVRKKYKEGFKEVIAGQLDALSEKVGRNVVFELVSTEINPRKRKVKRSKEAAIKGWYEKKKRAKGERVTYTTNSVVEADFGEPVQSWWPTATPESSFSRPSWLRASPVARSTSHATHGSSPRRTTPARGSSSPTR